MEANKPQDLTAADSSPEPCRIESVTRPHMLKFSIEKILSPEFGKTKRNGINGLNGAVEAAKNAGAEDRLAADADDEDSRQSLTGKKDANGLMWPAWVYCTRYSDRPSSGPRSRRMKKKEKKPDEKRPRTAFTGDQLGRLKQEFTENRYLTEKRRQDLARDLQLNESQIKIWFQNKRAKLKKANGPQTQRQGLAAQLMAQGLYNHGTLPPGEEQP